MSDPNPNTSAPVAANAAPPQPSAAGAGDPSPTLASEIAAELKKFEAAGVALVDKIKAKAKAELPAVAAELAKLEGELSPTLTWLKDHLRVAPLLIFFGIAMAATAFLNPAKVGLAVWGLAKLGMGGYVGYWIDRVVFPYARPHTQTGIAAGTAWKRRAVIVGAAVVAAALLP